MNETLAVIVALSFAGTKYIMALLFMFSYSYFNFWEAVFLATAGGMLGVVFFSYFGDGMKAVWYRFFPKKPNNRIIINSRRRLIVKIRQKYGLAGIAFLTPFVLTVPVGTLLASHIYKSKLQIFSYMFVSFTFWSVLLCSLYYLSGVDLVALVH